MRDLTEILAEGYTHGKFDQRNLTEKIQEILEFIIPKLSSLIKRRSRKGKFFLWESIRGNKRVIGWFRKALDQKIDRAIVIYVASKFTNNQYIGTKIIKEAREWK